MKLRRYVATDIPQMVEEIKAFCEENEFYSQVPFSSKRIEFLLRNNLTNTQMFCDLAFHDDGRLAGGLCALLMPMWISEVLVSEDAFIFVKPESRGSSAFHDLINAYKAWAEARGVRFVYAGISSGVKDDQFGQTMHKFGFRDLGMKYYWEPEK